MQKTWDLHPIEIDGAWSKWESLVQAPRLEISGREKRGSFVECTTWEPPLAEMLWESGAVGKRACASPEAQTGLATTICA